MLRREYSTTLLQGASLRMLTDCPCSTQATPVRSISNSGQCIVDRHYLLIFVVDYIGRDGIKEPDTYFRAVRKGGRHNTYPES